jgi:large exoprotein involved in heme utilization and adhesion
VLITGQNTTVFSQVVSGAQGNAGGIGIKAKSFYLTDDAKLTTSTFGLGNSGVVLVQADQVFLDNSAIFSTVESGGVGKALGIQIEAGSIVMNNNAELQTQTSGVGDAGRVILKTNGGLVSLDNSRIFSTVESGGEGDGGGISIETGTLLLNNGGQLQTLVREGGKGDAGFIYVEATNSVDLRGISPTTGNESGIFSIIDQGAEGGIGSSQFAGGIFDALLSGRGNNIVGSIFIDTGSISLTDNAQINTSTDGKGNAGAIIVQARDKASLTNGGAILSGAGENAEGNGGAILMGAGELSIEGTADNRSGLTTQTNGQGDAGLIYVEADRDISVKGDRSGFFSTVEGQGTGTAGAIIVNARSLFLRDGAQVSVNNQELGEAGGILINTQEDILLLRNAEISATTLSGEGGDIKLNVGDFLVLLGNSNISTTAGQAPGGGNGGNIRVNIDRPRATGLWGLPVNDSNITAQAYTGNGGSIRVNARRLYSIARRPLNLNTNDINASSTYGQEGLIEINDVDIDPTQGLNNLPQAPVDTSRLITQRCNVRGEDSEEVNKFTITGRGGIPSSPNDTLQGESVGTNWVTTDPPMENSPGSNSSTNPDTSVPSVTKVPKTPELVEAQGWVYGSHGEVILTANAPTATPHSSSLIPTASCNSQ